MHLYSRQRLLLNLIAAAGGRLGSTDLQKLLFLYVTKWDSEAGYRFVPHRFGCFSFQAAKDLETLTAKGCVKEDSRARWCLSASGQEQVNPAEARRLGVFVKQTVPERGDALISRISGFLIP